MRRKLPRKSLREALSGERPKCGCTRAHESSSCSYMACGPKVPEFCRAGTEKRWDIKVENWLMTPGGQSFPLGFSLVKELNVSLGTGLFEFKEKPRAGNL